MRAVPYHGVEMIEDIQYYVLGDNELLLCIKQNSFFPSKF